MVENHYPREDELTDLQKQKIAEVRRKCEDVSWRYPEYLTDFTILRWLMGWDYDVDVIIPKIGHAIKTLFNLKCHKMPIKSPEEINSYGRTLSPMSEYFPGGIMSQDREGNVVYVHCVGKVSPKTIVKGGPTSMLFKSCIIEGELAIKLVREAEAKNKRKLGCKVIVDMEGFSMDHLYMPAAKIYLALATLLQDLFADFGRVVYIINQPSIMSAAFAVISPVLSNNLKEKIKFLGNDWKDIICNDIGPENVYPQWGGTKTVGRPDTYLRMGGDVPEKLWYNPDANPDEKKLKKLSVNARSKGVVRVDGKKGKQFKWLFRVSSGDIDFSIEFDERTVYPVFRCTTDFHPEMDSFLCEYDGLYTFVFDNSHGLVFGKEIKHYIELM
ncbi:hypothetical protein WR25_21872 [Diploscapter pachys]|uniref:CRAL-TRIO domain-containing protein n=1 Tax=Diploscapter pachys TaxID=2018661 RepID=A0A2A2M0G0_9BILA|nr:hypothetical protein WR25_21872 [Diploscapter pachys]